MLPAKGTIRNKVKAAIKERLIGKWEYIGLEVEDGSMMV